MPAQDGVGGWEGSGLGAWCLVCEAGFRGRASLPDPWAQCSAGPHTRLQISTTLGQGGLMGTPESPWQDFPSLVPGLDRPHPPTQGKGDQSILQKRKTERLRRWGWLWPWGTARRAPCSPGSGGGSAGRPGGRASLHSTAPDQAHTPGAWALCCVSGVPVPEAVPSHGILLKPLHPPHRSAPPGRLRDPPSSVAQS